jgi:hypothetical protein
MPPEALPTVRTPDIPVHDAAKPKTEIPLHPPAEASSPVEFDHLAQYIEEIKSMREEINWRVKIAYNASIVFISALSLIGGTLFSSENKFIEIVAKDAQLMTVSGIAILVAISAWVGVQNANHLIEKRIELYTLELMKLVVAKTGHVHFSWLGFLYGSAFFRRKLKNGVAKFFNASIGMFIYLLPNLIGLVVWIYLIMNARIRENMFWFIAGSIFFFTAVGSTFLFFFYVVKVNNKFSEYYNQNMGPYFRNRGLSVHLP